MLVKLPLGSEFYTADGKLRDDLKYSINVDELKIRDSKIIGKPEDKFETMLFLPVGEGRKGEGGLRTRGYFKFSYKYIDKDWFICDIEGNPLKPAPVDIQEKINSYIASLPEDVRHKMTELPLITVITVVLNGEKYLEQTIQSVINQTYPNVEYIIIDGGSTDGTLDIVKKYEDRIDYWVSEKDRGIYDAMNKGITTATGSYVLLLNSDDYFFANKILQDIIVHLNEISKFPDIVYGDTCALEEINEQQTKYIVAPRSIHVLKYTMAFCHNSALVKLKLYKMLGLYSLKFFITSDHDFFLRVYMKNKIEYFYYVPYTIGTLRVHQESTSYKGRLRGIFENYMIAKENGVNKYQSAFVFLLRVLNYLIKSRMPFLKKFSFSHKIVKSNIDQCHQNSHRALNL